MKHINNPRVGAKYENRIQKLFFQTFKKFNQNASRKETFTKERIKKESFTKETSLFFSFSTNLFFQTLGKFNQNASRKKSFTKRTLCVFLLAQVFFFRKKEKV